MDYLFIAEKPSLMRMVESCYQKHVKEIQQHVGSIDFVSMAGHLCSNYMPDDYTNEPWSGQSWNDIVYPMVPSHWKIKPIANQRSQKLLSDISKKIFSYKGIIVGTDSDMEGYGIFYLLEQYLDIKNKKVLRFIERSLTEQEILKSLLSMTDFHADPIHVAFTKAFLLRSQADWLYGMNFSRIFSVQVGSPMNVGRVKAPTMKLIYDNCSSIEHFQSEKYFILEAVYHDAFRATLIDEKNKKIKCFQKKEQLPDVPNEGRIEEVKIDTIRTHAPQLYDLSALQAEAASTLKLSPHETLDIVQSLYEKHKCLSYPRTQCRYVSVEKAKEFPVFLEQAKVFPTLRPYVEQISDISFIYHDLKVVNDTEVAKESHDALIPTTTKPNLATMSEKEKAVCQMVYTRFLAQFLPQLTEKVTQIFIKHGENLFFAKGQSTLVPGWRALYGIKKEKILPMYAKGQMVRATSFLPQEKATTPPKRFSQATLLHAMITIASRIEDPALRKSLADSKGIGTAATRAAIILELISKGYVEERKHALYITEKGKKYVEHLKDVEILSPVFAAKIDMQIKKIQRRELNYEDAYNELLHDLGDSCKKIACKKNKAEYNGIEISDFKCPCCGQYLNKNKFSYSCSCGLSIPSTLCGVTFSDDEITKIILGKKSKIYSFKRKDKTTFRSAVILNKEKKKIQFIDPDEKAVNCPFCNAEAKLTKYGVFCDSCGFKLFRKVAQKQLTNKELRQLLKNKKTDTISGFVSQKGDEFSAKLILNDDKKLSFCFE